MNALLNKIASGIKSAFRNRDSDKAKQRIMIMAALLLTAVVSLTAVILGPVNALVLGLAITATYFTAKLIIKAYRAIDELLNTAHEVTEGAKISTRRVEQAVQGAVHQVTESAKTATRTVEQAVQDAVHQVTGVANTATGVANTAAQTVENFTRDVIPRTVDDISSVAKIPRAVTLLAMTGYAFPPALPWMLALLGLDLYRTPAIQEKVASVVKGKAAQVAKASRRAASSCKDRVLQRAQGMVQGMRDQWSVFTIMMAMMRRPKVAYQRLTAQQPPQQKGDQQPPQQKGDQQPRQQKGDQHPPAARQPASEAQGSERCFRVSSSADPSQKGLAV